MWTLTTALFNTMDNTNAAKGDHSSCTFYDKFRNAHVHAHTATIPLIFMFFAFYDIAYTPMLVAYTLEILPFNIRAKGFAVMVCTFEFIEIVPLTISSSCRTLRFA